MILGHERQKEYFRRILNSPSGEGCLAHAYLFHGPEGVGKFAFAQEIAKNLDCPYPIILDTQHTLLSKKEERKKIPIEDIQELKRLFSLTAPGKQWRIAIVNEAEKLSDDAANAFLKLLEEPGERTIFFLITPVKDLVFPTLASRTQTISFSYVSAKDLLAYLQPKISDLQKRKDILALSFGRPGEMIKLMRDQEYFEKEKRFIKTLQTCLSGGAPPIFKFTEKAAGDEDLRAKTGIWTMRLLREALLANPKAALSNTAKRALKVLAVLESSNVNPRLALDVLLLEASVK